MLIDNLEIQDDNLPISLMICGDTVQTKSNFSLFASGACEKLVGPILYNKIAKSDVTILNLEAPFSEFSEAMYKPGAPSLSMHNESINFFSSLPSKYVILSCANNHIKDYGISGIINTIDIISNSKKLRYIGIDKDCREKASKAFVIRKGLYKIGVYSCAENEFSIASQYEGGANGYDPLRTFDEIRQLKYVSDFVVVLFHAGREHYRYPSPNLKKICHKMVECGSNVVICQHSHCIGCMEEYQNGTIVYGQGNFIFDRLKREEWDSGLAIELSVSDTMVIDYFPVRRNGNTICIAEDENSTIIMKGFCSRSKEIINDKFVEASWKKFCFEQLDVYCIQGLLGINNRYVLAFERRLGFPISKFMLKNKYHIKLLNNFLRCESIYESIQTVLQNDN